MNDQDDTPATDPAAPDQPAPLHTPGFGAANGRDRQGGSIALTPDTVAALVRLDILSGQVRRRREKQRSMPTGGWT